MPSRTLNTVALALSLGSALATSAAAQDRAAQILASDQSRDDFAAIARQIWSYAELGYQEHRSSALLQSEPSGAGFQVEKGVAGMPTAVIAAEEWMERSGRSGTIRVFGTPAEEGGSGQAYMVRAGLFDDVDAVLHWHPGSVNQANPSSSLANTGKDFAYRALVGDRDPPLDFRK